MNELRVLCHFGMDHLCGSDPFPAVTRRRVGNGACL